MNNLRQAAEMALETLETVPIEYDFHGNFMDDEFGKQLDATIQALRQALDQLPDATKMIDTGTDRGAWSDVENATKWVDELRGDDDPEPELIGEIIEAHGLVGVSIPKMPPVGTKLYAAPPDVQKTRITDWQGLTDAEIAEGQHQSWVTKSAWESAVWWAEAKLREKNT